MKHHFWAKAINTSSNIRNNLLIDGKGEAIPSCGFIYSKTPRMSHFQIFGYRAFVYIAKHQRERNVNSQIDERLLEEYCRGDEYRITTSYKNRNIKTKKVKIEGVSEGCMTHGYKDVIKFDTSNSNILIDKIQILQDDST